jgi:predicted TIM-barrel fold metal-dependent hydrolase
MNADDLILISVDDHIAEPADMFLGHVPESLKDRAPQVVTDDDGYQQWWYGDRKGRNLGLNAVAGKPPEMFNVNPQRYEEMRPGCYNVHERVRDMSAGGQLAGLNFPNWTGFSGQVLWEGTDLALNQVMIEAYNDWHVDEWCASYPDRFIPCGILPLYDVDKSAAEVRRLATKGCHAVTFSENPAALQLPSIHSGHWDPLFAACSDEGTVLCLHVGSSSRSAATSLDAPASVAMSISSAMSIYSLADLMWADFWWRFPNLRFSLTEGDIGWIPYFLQRAEHIQARHVGWTRHQFPTGMGPADVFHERVLCCFINDRIGVKLIDEFNIDNVCWESDYPHSDTSWPRGP